MTHHDTARVTPVTIERHFCPGCGRVTRHHVTRARVPAPVLWCLSCYHLRVVAPTHAVVSIDGDKINRRAMRDSPYNSLPGPRTGRSPTGGQPVAAALGRGT